MGLPSLYWFLGPCLQVWQCVFSSVLCKSGALIGWTLLTLQSRGHEKSRTSCGVEDDLKPVMRLALMMFKV